MNGPVHVADGRIRLIDGDQHEVGTSTDANGGYHLNTASIQKIISSTNNSTSDNLASGTSITIYDNVTATAPVIGVITTTSGAIGEWTYNAPFSNGLTLVTVGNSLDATVIYE